MTKKKTEIVENNSEYGTCWFCKERPAEDKAAFGVQMHADVTREYVGAVRQTQWRRITVPVPRCTRCKSVHNRFRLWTMLGTVLGAICGGAILVWFISADTAEPLGTVAAVITLVAVFGCFAAGPVIVYAIHRRRTPKGVKLTAWTGKNYPEVKRLKSEGWKLGGKPGYFE
jgi:hypothetical protein